METPQQEVVQWRERIRTNLRDLVGAIPGADGTVEEFDRALEDVQHAAVDARDEIASYGLREGQR